MSSKHSGRQCNAKLSNGNRCTKPAGHPVGLTEVVNGHSFPKKKTVIPKPAKPWHKR